MVKTASTMLTLGTPAPAFSLKDVVSGDELSLDKFDGKKGLLVMFICQHCPFVRHVESELSRLGQDYVPAGLGFLAISANSVETHPQDSPDKLREQVERAGFNFPYAHDETQEVAKRYTAACTPDFFLFDRDRKLVYRGQLDNSRPGNDEPVTGADLRTAIDKVIAGEPVSEDQKPSIGCNIKWAPGNEPDYFG